MSRTVSPRALPTEPRDVHPAGSCPYRRLSTSQSRIAARVPPSTPLCRMRRDRHRRAGLRSSRSSRQDAVRYLDCGPKAMEARARRDREMRRSLRKLPQAKDRAAVRLATGNVGLYRLGYRTMSAPSSTGRRRCSMCRKFKPLSDFPVKNKARGTLRSYCRDCCRVYAKRHYQRNRAAYLRRTHGRHHADRAACRALAYE